MRTLAFIVLLTPFQAPADEYLCTYQWSKDEKAQSIMIETKPDKAIVHSRMLDLEFRIASDTHTELLIYQPFTKAEAGANYPVGFTTMVLDKKTREFVFSNNFVSGNENNFAKGECVMINRD